MTNHANNTALLSYQLVGKRLGISAVRVRQIEQRALCKLRAGLLKLGVRKADLTADAEDLPLEHGLSGTHRD